MYVCSFATVWERQWTECADDTILEHLFQALIPGPNSIIIINSLDDSWKNSCSNLNCSISINHIFLIFRYVYVVFSYRKKTFYDDKNFAKRINCNL